jgi:short-subunit dehydrogenase
MAVSSSPSSSTIVLAVLGSLIGVYYAYNITCFLYLYVLHRSTLSRYLQPPTSPPASASDSQPWALITGASDGIGRGFAHELASHGFNIILHGRSPTKLVAVATALKAEHPRISTRLFVLDVYPSNAAAIEDFVRSLVNDGLHIRVLVNNIGGGGIISPTFRPFAQLLPVDVQKLFDFNVAFPTLLTRTLLPAMQEPALILNLGSFVAKVPGPMLTVYAGCKAFNMQWSRSLAVELRAEGKDVEVMGLLVGEVQSSRHRELVGPFVCTSRMLARSALDRVGCGRHILVPWWRHAVAFVLVGCFPDTVVDKIMVGTNVTRMEKDKRIAEEEKRKI